MIHVALQCLYLALCVAILHSIEGRTYLCADVIEETILLCIVGIGERKAFLQAFYLPDVLEHKEYEESQCGSKTCCDDNQNNDKDPLRRDFRCLAVYLFLRRGKLCFGIFEFVSRSDASDGVGPFAVHPAYHVSHESIFLLLCLGYHILIALLLAVVVLAFGVDGEDFLAAFRGETDIASGLGEPSFFGQHILYEVILLAGAGIILHQSELRAAFRHFLDVVIEAESLFCHEVMQVGIAISYHSIESSTSGESLAPFMVFGLSHTGLHSVFHGLPQCLRRQGYRAA